MIACYAEKHKPKSRQLLEAFAEGCGGKMAFTTDKLQPGPVAFYGVRKSFVHLFKQAKDEGRDWYYIDNSYFDCVRERQFRITKNAMQHTGLGESDGKRFESLGIEIKPMREGEDAVIAAQSKEFMELVEEPDWLDRVTVSLLDTYGRARVIVRTKQEKRPLLEDLKNASLLVTWSSAAAVTALLEGVRVMCAPECCATYADDRKKWASVLADNQWTEAEIRNGMAWETLQA